MIGTGHRGSTSVQCRKIYVFEAHSESSIERTHGLRRCFPVHLDDNRTAEDNACPVEMKGARGDSECPEAKEAPDC